MPGRAVGSVPGEGRFLEAQQGAGSQPPEKKKKTRVIPPTRVNERPCNFAHGRFFFFAHGTIGLHWKGSSPPLRDYLLRARGAAAHPLFCAAFETAEYYPVRSNDHVPSPPPDMTAAKCAVLRYYR